MSEGVGSDGFDEANLYGQLDKLAGHPYYADRFTESAEGDEFFLPVVTRVCRSTYQSGGMGIRLLSRFPQNRGLKMLCICSSVNPPAKKRLNKTQWHALSMIVGAGGRGKVLPLVLRVLPHLGP